MSISTTYCLIRSVKKINEICISKLREKESSISLNGHIPVVYTAKNSEGPPREGASGVVTGPVPQETTGVVQQQTHEERDVPDRETERTMGQKPTGVLTFFTYI